MKRLHIHASFLIAILVLIFGQLPPTRVTALAQVPEGTNCMVTPIHLRGNLDEGQPDPSPKRMSEKLLSGLFLRHSPYPGAVGETVDSLEDALVQDTNNGAQYPPDAESDPTQLGGGAAMISTLSSSGLGVGPDLVAILVLDDFSHMPAHGWMVYDFFTLLSQSVPGFASRIHIEPVNIADASVGLVSDALVPLVQQHVDQLRRLGYNRFILNMSFALAPCDALNFEEFLAQHREDPTYSLIQHLGGDEQAVTTLLASIDFDTFADYVLNNDLVSSGEIVMIPVASAGNFAQAEPFFPAHFEGFISVSASVAGFSPEIKWPMSNAGEVSAIGAWFALKDGHFHAGTSLAAPVVSALLALDQSSGNPNCSVDVATPALRSTAVASAPNAPFGDTPVLDAISTCF